MLDYFWLWSEMIVRWVHVIAGVAWIGSSFYFIALDLSLKPGKKLPKEANGQAWQVHGGGFYNMVKYLVAPSKMPEELTWFKWEAYSTWISGMALMSLVYYGSTSLYMIDLEVLDITQGQAVLLSLGGILVGWVIYDGLCRSPLGRNDLIYQSSTHLLHSLLQPLLYCLHPRKMQAQVLHLFHHLGTLGCIPQSCT